MNALNLQKEVEKFGLVLEKRGARKGIQANVGFNIDVSGSMQGLFRAGAVQRLVEKMLPAALTFDDNGTLDLWCFHHGVSVGVPVTAQNFENYVTRDILNNKKLSLWGSTCYSPVLRANQQQFCAPAKTGFMSNLFNANKKVEQSKPTIIYHVTDGVSEDEYETAQLLRSWEQDRLPIYVLFVGIGPVDFRFLEKQADERGNVGFVSVKNLEGSLNDDMFYEFLAPVELVSWLNV